MFTYHRCILFVYVKATYTYTHTLIHTHWFNIWLYLTSQPYGRDGNVINIQYCIYIDNDIIIQTAALCCNTSIILFYIIVQPTHMVHYFSYGGSVTASYTKDYSKISLLVWGIKSANMLIFFFISNFLLIKNNITIILYFAFFCYFVVFSLTHTRLYVN